MKMINKFKFYTGLLVGMTSWGMFAAQASPIRGNEDPQYFGLTENSVEMNLFRMDELRLNEGKAARKPWSGSEWPLNKGAIARSYDDAQFQNSEDWQVNYEHFLRSDGKPPASAAEKYDALVGDSRRTLTRTSWNRGLRYQEAYGQVAPWMSLGNGWAAASILFPEPTRELALTSPAGEKILLSSDDIKGLASLFVAGKNQVVRFIGSRCHAADSAKAGQEQAPPCAGLNAGAWHAALVHRLGQNKKSLIANLSPVPGQVNNRPLASYRYRYFNPITNESASLKEALVALRSLPKGQRKERANNTCFIVGVELDLEAVEPTEASPNSSDVPLSSPHRYRYDLELDERGTILGGKWHQEHRPDFVWYPSLSPSSPDLNAAVNQSNEWKKPSKAVPLAWRDEAFAASAVEQRPLAPIVERLVEWSAATAR